jgi:hypothetical protein
MLSIIVPYLSNSKCINLFKEVLKENTSSQYELIEIVDETDVYYAFNQGVKKSKGDIVVLINDDMFVSKNWDISFIKYAQGKTLITGYVVEPGVIQVSDKNIQGDFGKHPNKYERQKFEKWADKQSNEIPEYINGKGWYMPLAIQKEYFIEYPNDIKYPHPNDCILIDEIMPRQGYNFIKVNSFFYHLQAFTTHSNINRN